MGQSKHTVQYIYSDPIYSLALSRRPEEDLPVAERFRATDCPVHRHAPLGRVLLEQRYACVTYNLGGLHRICRVANAQPSVTTTVPHALRPVPSVRAGGCNHAFRSANIRRIDDHRREAARSGQPPCRVLERQGSLRRWWLFAHDVLRTQKNARLPVLPPTGVWSPRS